MWQYKPYCLLLSEKCQPADSDQQDNTEKKLKQYWLVAPTVDTYPKTCIINRTLVGNKVVVFINHM